MAENDFGYGQQDPTVQNSDLNMTAFLVAQMLSRVDTMKIVEVVKVTPGEGEGDGDVKKAGTVDVHPLVNQIDGNGNATPHGIVYGVPWVRLQGGKNSIVCDPEVGDIGFVVVSDRDISVVKSTGKEGNPGSRRRFNLSDGVYVGGILNVAPEQYLLFTADGVRLVDKAGNSVEMASTGITLKPATGTAVIVDGNLIVKQNLQLVGSIQGETEGSTYPGNLEIGGDVVAKKGAGDISLENHVHQYDRPTGPSTPADTQPPSV